ncbi:MAG TPA: winged helix-turn-helix domain-containing protein [Polyangiaceae bacterium]|nr:winged helix-turn-helix domain-containing protein [Polyangiaceae bacterium]
MSIEPSKGVEKDRGDVAAFGPFRLLPTARLLKRDGRPVEIGGRALDVLIELVKQAGRVVSKTDLMSAIWTDTTVVEGVLRTHVYNLRKVLGDGVAGARYVTSVAGRGYCFVAPVIQSPGEAASPATPNVWTLAHGLPPPLARMAGRDEVVRRLAAQLTEHRFVSVLGAPGIGKTTVAVAVGHALLDDFGGAVRFIDLGALTDPALVVPTVASTLGVPMHADHALERLQAFLQAKRVLLVLDNCEHVVDAAARLGEYIFLHAPRVHLLTTSREALRIEGEHPYLLGPLDTPTDVVGMNAETVQTFAAVQVFLERAAASGWSGELTDDDVVIVAETCKRLDGVALAIELAASFVGQCGLQGMPAILDDRLGLLWQHGRRSAPARQQTLHALITWSYDRLREHERVVLRRLSVFVGAFSFDAAKAVVLEGGERNDSLLEVINELVAQSLLSASVEDGAIVYRLLETTRVYALERLAENGELDGTSLRHARLFVERRERAADLGNVRAALKWSFSSPAGHAVGVRLAAAAARLLLELGLVNECQSWCRQALDVIQAPDSGTFVEVGLQEAFAISTMFSRGNGEDVRGALTRGAELARALGGGDHEVRLLGHLNSFLIRRGDFKEALEVADRSITPARAATVAGQERAEWMLAFSHHLRGNQTVAEEHCEAALRLEAASGDMSTVVSGRSQGLFSHPHLGTLARTLWLRGHADRALAGAHAIVNGVSAQRHPFEKSSALILCEAIFVWCGEWAEAERLLDTLFELVERYSLGSQRGAATALRGELLVRSGRPEEGCTLLRTAASMQKAQQNASFVSVYACALAEGLAATGSLEEALGTVEGAIVEAEERGGAFNLPELLRVKGEILALRSPAEERAVAEALLAAIELARRQGALAWELRATASLARERLTRGGSADVLSDLSAVYARFTEGMETPDLQEARSLLQRRAHP